MFALQQTAHLNITLLTFYKQPHQLQSTTYHQRDDEREGYARLPYEIAQFCDLLSWEKLYKLCKTGIYVICSF